MHFMEFYIAIVHSMQIVTNTGAEMTISLAQETKLTCHHGCAIDEHCRKWSQHNAHIDTCDEVWQARGRVQQQILPWLPDSLE